MSRMGNSSDTFFTKQTQLVEKGTEIKVFHLMVKWLKYNESIYRTDPKDNKKWEKISNNLSLFGISAEKYSPERCREIFYDWSKFYAEEYTFLNEYLDENSQKIFDLLKIVHILDFTHFWSRYEWTLICLQRISEKNEIKDKLSDWMKSLSLETPFNETQDQIQSNETQIHDLNLFWAKKDKKNLKKKNRSESTKDTTFDANTSKENNALSLSELSDKLIKSFKDIEAFNLMVQMMEPFVSKTQKKEIINWETISQNLCEFGYSSQIYSHIICREKFYYWSEFYAQNYHKLEAKLDQKSQEIFDLFKLIHVLDLNKLWSSKDPTLSLLNMNYRDLVSKNSFIFFNSVQKERKPMTTTNNSSNIGGDSTKTNENEDNVTKELQLEWLLFKIDLKDVGLKRQKVPQNLIKVCDEVILSFEDMNLHKELLRGIYAYGLDKPSAIQQRAIVPCIKGRDVIAQAQSGMGKTAAFVISILQMIETSLNECQALILAPTRELAQQIQKVVLELGKYMGIECYLCIGGTPVRENIRLLQMDVHVVVGTVGRISQLIEIKALTIEKIKILVLDESDQLLDLSQWLSQRNYSTFQAFTHKIFEIIKLMDPKTQLFLSSATMPPEILKLNSWLMRSPINILVKNEELTLEGIKQFYIQTVIESFKLETFCDLYNYLSKSQTFVYCNTREKVDQLSGQLMAKGITVANIHGNMDQRQREAILGAFRVGVYRVLITSDLLGRGIDVQQVSNVVNYDLPRNFENYIHRVGRSGRFGRKGIAITFITSRETETLRELTKFYNTNIEELPTNLSEIL